jgi:hypothetical protein
MKTISKWGISLVVLFSALAHGAPPPVQPITRDEIDKKIEAVEKRLVEKTDALDKRGLELKLLEEKIDIKKDVANSIVEVRKDTLAGE